MDACPQCGGAQLSQIAPGYFECHSRRDEDGTCGHRFQVSAGGSVMEVCSCGTFAIGYCARCGTPVCGDHSGLHGDERLCATHLTGEQQAATRRIATDERQRVDAFDRLLDSFVDVAREAGSPGLTRFRLCPDKGWKSLASDRGWLILGTRGYGEGAAATRYLLPDRTVTVVLYTVNYLSTGYQEGHYDKKLRRSSGMRSGFREPLYIPADERARKLSKDWDEIADSLGTLAARHELNWTAPPKPST